MTTNTDVHTCSYYCERPECIKRQRDEMRDRMAAALAQQPAAAMGEEIMVNAAHGVYTLPLQPSWLLSGPRFVVYVPAPEQQPAAPSGAVNVVGMPEFDGLMDHIHEYGTTADGVVERANAFARAVLARYAPQQPAVVDEAMVERACRHWYVQWDKADRATKMMWAEMMYDLLAAALAKRGDDGDKEA